MLENTNVYIINKESFEIVKRLGLKGLHNTKYFSQEIITIKKGFFYINNKKIPFQYDL
jgi:hypothetical protein